MLKLAESHSEMLITLPKLAEGKIGGIDDATKSHVRNLDNYLSRLVEDSASGRSEMIQELRAEIRLLARTIAASSEENDGRH